VSERARVRRHYGPLCSTLVATKSGSICIAVNVYNIGLFTDLGHENVKACDDGSASDEQGPTGNKAL